jgi:cation diffusion facilitator CzcD-associated flavoprotein CzcO
MTETVTRSAAAEGRVDDAGARVYDVVIVGAGLTGMYQLMLVRKLGLSVRVIEAGSGVGGTWYWNAYPGARLDSESYSYQYSWDKELLEEWRWKEMFAGQPELEAYYNRVADKYDLRSDIDFDTRIETMVFDEEANDWTLRSTEGETYRARVVIAATGILSDPNFPRIPGLETFKGEWYHTSLWPKDKDVSFEGKRIAVIGTGATGVQVIPKVAETAGHLTVFQRTANWAVPLRNRPLSDEDMAGIRAGYDEMFPHLRKTFSGFLHSWDPIKSTEVSPEVRDARYLEAWNSPGFTKWIGLYNDLAYDADANKIYCAFLADKIRERVNDKELAEKLVPNDHLFGTKRVPCETNYYETYNKENVDLVLLKEDPIIEFTEKGIRTESGELEVDMIILATGFDAFTGALNKIDIRGLDGQTLRESWKDGPHTYLGMQVAGFPNLFIEGGPHGKGGHGNGPRCSEPVVEWVTKVIDDIFTNDWKRVDADPAAQDAWTKSVTDTAAGTLQASAKSIFFGDNIPGKPRVYVAYIGSLPEFVQRLEDARDNDYEGFLVS